MTALPEDETTGRCNFRLPIKTFNLMLEMARDLGIESTSGAGRHFCIKGIEASMAQYAAYKAAATQATSMNQNQQSVQIQQAMLSVFEAFQQEEKSKKQEDQK